MVNFTMIENDIRDGTFRLYSILNSYCFRNKTTCFPSQETLEMRKSSKNSFSDFTQRKYNFNNIETAIFWVDIELAFY